MPALAPLSLPERPAIALSGGLDSRFLCARALAAGLDVLALHARGPHVPPAETDGAAAFARAMGLRLETVDADPLSIPEVASTSRERCRFCKGFMLRAMKRRLRDLGEDDRTLCDGGNADDLSRFRPGIAAAREEGVRSPLAEAGVTKAMIRAEARTMGFPPPKGAPRPCLLTRYAYGLRVDREELARLALAEADLAALEDGSGAPLLGDFRLRLTPAPLLQVERAPADMEPVAEVLARAGFAPFEVAETCAVSGFFDGPRGGASGS